MSENRAFLLVSVGGGSGIPVLGGMTVLGVNMGRRGVNMGRLEVNMGRLEVKMGRLGVQMGRRKSLQPHAKSHESLNSVLEIHSDRH